MDLVATLHMVIIARSTTRCQLSNEARDVLAGRKDALEDSLDRLRKLTLEPFF